MIPLGFSTFYCYQQYLLVLMSFIVYECRSIDVCVFFLGDVYQRYMYFNTHFPVEKHLCIYIIYIESVSFCLEHANSHLVI